MSDLSKLKPSQAAHIKQASKILVQLLYKPDCSQLPATAKALGTWTGYQAGKALSSAQQWEQAGLTEALAAFIGGS